MVSDEQVDALRRVEHDLGPAGFVVAGGAALVHAHLLHGHKDMVITASGRVGQREAQGAAVAAASATAARTRDGGDGEGGGTSVSGPALHGNDLPGQWVVRGDGERSEGYGCAPAAAFRDVKRSGRHRLPATRPFVRTGRAGGCVFEARRVTESTPRAGSCGASRRDRVDAPMQAITNQDVALWRPPDRRLAILRGDAGHPRRHRAVLRAGAARLARRPRAVRCRRARFPGLNAYVLFFALPCMLFRFGAEPAARRAWPIRPCSRIYLVRALLMVALTIAVTLRTRRRPSTASTCATPPSARSSPRSRTPASWACRCWSRCSATPPPAR